MERTVVHILILSYNVSRRASYVVSMTPKSKAVSRILLTCWLYREHFVVMESDRVAHTNRHYNPEEDATPLKRRTRFFQAKKQRSG